MRLPDLSALTAYLDQGGIVLWPLLILSVWMWYLIVKKLAVLMTWKAAGQPEKAGGIADEWRRITDEYRSRRISDAAPDDEWNRRLLATLVRKRQRELERHVRTIFVLAAMAPLLGLLGTVTGMISTFEAIARFGTANARAMAAGISEALVTTQIGLVVAVPGLFMGHFIRRRTDALQTRLDRLLLRHASGATRLITEATP